MLMNIKLVWYLQVLRVPYIVNRMTATSRNANRIEMWWMKLTEFEMKTRHIISVTDKIFVNFNYFIEKHNKNLI